MINKEDYVHVGTDEAHNRYMEDCSFKDDVKKVYNNIEYRMKVPDLLGKTLMITDKQFPLVYQIAYLLAKKMDMEIPAIYVFEDFFYGVESYGMDDYWIELSAKTVRDFSIKELTFLFARELYKIKYGVVFQTMLMNQLFKIYSSVPMAGEIMEKASRTKFNHWCRLENFTADNFAYLMCGEIQPCVNAILAMVLNSKSMLEQVDMRTFVKQASSINKLDDTVSNYTKSDEMLPYAPFRVESLLAYAVSKRGMKVQKELKSC